MIQINVMIAYARHVYGTMYLGSTLVSGNTNTHALYIKKHTPINTIPYLDRSNLGVALYLLEDCDCLTKHHYSQDVHPDVT